MTTFTVGDYLAQRLAELGISEHFVVAGDYNLILLDKLRDNPKTSQVCCTNELNCSMAAEGYARAKGAGVCIVTYSVGAFSAFNGIGSAYAEHLPVILVSGAPNTNDDAQFHLLHHTLGEHDSTYQIDMAQRITCCAVAVRRAYDAPRLIDRAIKAALQAKRPAYIEIPTNVSATACARPGPLSGLVRSLTTDPEALDLAIKGAAEYVKAKEKPIILVGPKLGRAHAQNELLLLAESLGCAVAIQPAAKGLFPEDHKQFIGVFWGQVSQPATSAIMEWADGIVCLGTVFTDYSTVGWTALPSFPVLQAGMDHVALPHGWFNNVNLGEFLVGLAKAVSPNVATVKEYHRIRPGAAAPRIPQPDESLTRKEIIRQLQGIIDGNTTIFAETGDSWFNGMQLQLPEGAQFEIEMQWGHIGWSIPASFGYAMANPSRKMIVMVGDGSFQVSAQEVSQMVRRNLPIIILLINNYGYTIEVEIHDGPYNRIKNWDYVKLIEAFNSSDGHAQGYRAANGRELHGAIAKAQAHTAGPTLIECIIDRDDCSTELITWGHLVATANARPPAPVDFQ